MNGPLHIAMVVRSFSTGGGLELYAHKVIEGLLAQGIKITVICQEQQSELTAANLSVVLFPAPDKHLPKWQKLDLQFKAATEAAARSGPFDLIHTQHFPIDGANVVTFHNHSVQHLSKVGTSWENLLNKGKELFAPAYKARDRYDRILCQNAGSFIFPSLVCRNDFRTAMKSSCDLDQTPYVVAHPGADLESDRQFATTARPSERGDPFTFLFVGRGYRRKGLDTVLKACSILRRKGKSFKLEIAGLSKKPLDSLRLDILGIAADVEYLGFRQDMDYVYKQARAFIMPSRHDVFGMAPLQAMHRGLPPIVSRCMGVSELLTDRQNALILDNHLDAARLADLMTELMDDSALYERLSSNVTAVAQATSWNNCVEATLEAYRLAVHSDLRVDNSTAAKKSAKKGDAPLPNRQ